MPTVAIEGPFRFVINTRENLFEPPHVHVWVHNDVCRIDLNGATYDRIGAGPLGYQLLRIHQLGNVGWVDKIGELILTRSLLRRERREKDASVHGPIWDGR